MFKVTNLPVPILYLTSLVIMVIFFAIAYLRLPPQIPLFYSLPVGTQQIVDTWLIVVVPVVSLLCILANMFMTTKILKNNPFTANVGRIANIAILVASTYVFIKIIILVAL